MLRIDGHIRPPFFLSPGCRGLHWLATKQPTHYGSIVAAAHWSRPRTAFDHRITGLFAGRRNRTRSSIPSVAEHCSSLYPCDKRRIGVPINAAPVRTPVDQAKLWTTTPIESRGTRRTSGR
jgi:hypothetical protein